MQWIFIFVVPAIISVSCSKQPDADKNNVAVQSETKAQTMSEPNNTDEKVIKSNQEWKEILTPEQYFVLRQSGTERPYTGEYNDHYEKGVYKCAACGQVLFESDTKFPSHCGWPAFYDVEAKGKVIRKTDKSHGMTRTEVLCSKCGGHLGHVFQDGPAPTGLRYCINSAALKFEKEHPKEEK